MQKKWGDDGSPGTNQAVGDAAQKRSGLHAARVVLKRVPRLPVGCGDLERRGCERPGESNEDSHTHDGQQHCQIRPQGGAVDAREHRHSDDRSRLEVDGMLVLVREVGAAILHLHDLRLGIARVHPLLVRALLRPLAVESRQVLARRLLVPLGLRQVDEVLPVLPPVVAADDRTQRRVRLERRRVNADRLPVDQTCIRETLQHPREDRLVRLEIDQPPRARNRRVIRRRLWQHESEKLAQRKRIGRSPGNRALRIQTFEVADQQQPEVTAGRQAGPALVGIEPLTEPLDEAVEVVLIEHLIESRVEGVAGTAGQVLRRHPHRRLLRTPLSFAHRHRRQCSTPDRSRRFLNHRFTTGC